MIKPSALTAVALPRRRQSMIAHATENSTPSHDFDAPRGSLINNEPKHERPEEGYPREEITPPRFECARSMFCTLVPSVWLDLFRDFSLRAMADRQIIEDLLSHDQLDLRRASPVEDLNAARAISIIASNDQSLFRLHERIRAQQFAISRNLRLNPSYKKTARQRGIVVRELPTASFVAEYPLSAAYLPERIPLSRSIEGNPSDLSPTARETALQLFKQFVLVDLPAMYVR